VGIWDFDEFLIPRGENKNLLDLIESASGVRGSSSGVQSRDGGRRGGPGWADRKDHPYCYLMLK
jgi:hypothetical protein